MAFPSQLSLAMDRNADLSPVHSLRVLLIEDDPDLAQMLVRFLTRTGMQACAAYTGAEAVRLKNAHSPHVVLVDLDLPDIDGEALLRWLADQGDCGIIVVSGHMDETRQVMCLELGADDYVTKPPGLGQLSARIRAVHRRLGERSSSPTTSAEQTVVTIGDFKVSLQSRQVRDGTDTPVEMTAAEFGVLAALIEARGTPISREQLSECVLRRPWRQEDRSIDQLIYRVRQKLSLDMDGRRIIQSIRNGGYVLTLPETASL